MDQFENLTIGQLRKLTEDYKKLKEVLGTYQKDVKNKKEPHTAQELIDWVEEDE